MSKKGGINRKAKKGKRMVIHERSTVRNEVSLPSIKKNLTIVTLEEQIHTRRLEIKRFNANLQMFGTLNANGLTDSDNFSTERTSVVNRMLELNKKQHSDRKELRPHKRAKETKGKSPFNHAVNTRFPSESKPVARTVPSRKKEETILMRKKPEPVVLYEGTRHNESNADGDLLTTRITQIRKQLESLRIQKKNGEISPKGYRVQKQELISVLHDTERRRGHKPIRTKGSKILTS